MILADLSSVLAACEPTATQDDYRAAVIDGNVAGKDSLSSRQRTFRYLRELYRLDVADPPFRALRRLWARDQQGRPLIALIMSSTNDPAFAATAPGILSPPVGEAVTAAGLADAIEREFPGSYSAAVRAKIGRNALSSWTQAGYLHRVGPRAPALRQVINPTAGAVAMALVLGETQGVTGERLFSTPQATLLDTSTATMHDRIHDAARKGWLEYRSRGQITEIVLSALTAPIDDPRLPLTETESA